MYQFKYLYLVLGGHTHVQFFAGRKGLTLGKSGEFVLLNAEFEGFRVSTENVPASHNWHCFEEQLPNACG